MDCPKSVTVVIVTRNRPQMVRQCLEHLGRQTLPADEIIVVDSSTGEDTQVVLDCFPEAKSLRIPNGRNNRPQAKNLAIEHALGEIVAFLDDDSMVRQDWLAHLVAPYIDSVVGGVGGRVIDVLEQARARPGDPRVGVLGADGKATTNFGLDTGRMVEVDHLRGCNMSFRRRALVHVGGFDPKCLGSNVGEEADLCLRIKCAGWTILYQPQSVVDHLAAPREDMHRATGTNESFLLEPWPILWSAHNRSYLLFKNFGYNHKTARHVLGGMQILFIRLLLAEPSWARLRAAILYGLGSWWGLIDSISVRLRRQSNAREPSCV